MHIVVFHTLHLESVRLIRWGSTSTSLFFLLSGFILAYTYAAPGGVRIPDREFWWRRFSRLYPLGVIAQAVTIPVLWAQYPPGDRALRAGVVLLGVQGWFTAYATSFNSPGWSVSVLAFCYLVFPAILRMISRWTPAQLTAALLGAWVWCLLPAAAYIALDGGPFWLDVINHHPLSRFPEFLVGVLAARRFLAVDPTRVPWWTAIAGLTLLGAAILLLPESLFPLAHNGLLAPAHSILVVGLAAGSGPVARLLAGKRLQALGEVSFALFLVHVPIYAWTVMPLAPFTVRQPFWFRVSLYVAYLALSLAVAWVVQRCYADPVARLLRKWVRGAPAPTPPHNRVEPPAAW